MYSGLFPSRLKTLAPKIWLHKLLERIRSFLKLSKIWNPPYFKSALPHSNVFTGYTKIYFAENRLYLSLISLSLLITSHLNLLSQIRVRPSNKNVFSLLMIRSLSFGYYYFNLKKVLVRFHFVLKNKLAKIINSLAHYAKGTL